MAVTKIDPEESVRRRFGDPAEVLQYSALVAEGLTPFEAALVRKSFVEGQHILDIGCGSGREAVAMAQRGLRVIGVDIVLVMVQAAKVNRAEKGPMIACLVGDVVSLPFRDASFDGATMFNQVLSFVPRRDGRVEALRSVWRALRPGGKLAMTTHNRGCHWRFRLYFALMNRFRRLKRRFGHDHGLGDNDRWSARNSRFRSRHPVFFHMYDLDEAIADLQAAGFEVLDARARAEYEADRNEPALRTRDYLLGFIVRRPLG